MGVRVFGIRHHGPGSARALARSLDAWRPDAVLVEGPPDADRILALAAGTRMRPPVALLGYLPARPESALFYPFASWSPEWVALRHAFGHGVPVSMIDLPVAAFLGARARPEPAGDPFTLLARAGGYDDPERWWEDMIEHRGGEEPWDAVTEAVAALRAEPVGGVDHDGASVEARREAAMRSHIRRAEKEHRRVAVVCGAWHAPALVERGPASTDARLLRGLPRQRAAVTWVPWTNGRLAYESGYGAGVRSPGWYEHLYVSRDRPVERWLVKVASVLRSEQLDADTASVIDAVRLADALATLRGRPLAGLTECTDAARAVLTGGHDAPLALIERRLVIGDAIGSVPPETPMVALAADLAAQQRRLRLKPEATARTLDLDLRRDVDLGRSHLLHRLDLLGVPWGTVDHDVRGTGTFRETWTLQWAPELAIRVIEASAYGTTVSSAAEACAVEAAGWTATLGEVTALLERGLLADLPGAVPAALTALDTRSAASSDVGELLDAVPPLARVLRYGTVRRTDVTALGQVVRGLVGRICVGLAPACASLDDDAAAAMTARIGSLSSALGALDDADLRSGWFDTLRRLAAAGSLHGLVAGRSSRLLLDAGRMPASEVAQAFSAALSPGEAPSRGAAWVEGLLGGGGLLLAHDPVLLAVLDEWLTRVGGDVFDDVLPLLRRTFAEFEPGARRLIARSAARLGASGGPDGAGGPRPADGRGPGGFDETRASAVLPLLRRLLGPSAGPDG